MKTLKSALTAIAVAAVAVSTAQAEGLSSALPLGKSLAAGNELPLPLGVSANVYYLEQDMEAQSISIDVPPMPLPGGPPLQLPPGLPASTTKLESRATSTTAKIDAWLLPFLNVYGVAGYVDGETNASGFSVAGLPPQVAGLLPNSFSVTYSGPVYGGGATLAATPLRRIYLNAGTWIRGLWISIVGGFSLEFQVLRPRIVENSKGSGFHGLPTPRTL